MKNGKAPEPQYQNDEREWVPSVATDVMATWRKHGFTPPSELPEYQEKWRRVRERG